MDEGGRDPKCLYEIAKFGTCRYNIYEYIRMRAYTIRKRNRKKNRRSLHRAKRINKNRRLYGGNNKIKLLHWWNVEAPGTGVGSAPFFEAIFDKCTASLGEVNIYSVFPGINSRVEKETSKSVLRVQFSGESNYGDPDKFDINFITGDHPTRESVIPIPFASFFMYCAKFDVADFTMNRVLKKPQSRFCLFSVSNPVGEERNMFFKELSKYKLVDSCGKYMNNMGKECPGVNYESKEYYDFISQYKFMICFENKSVKNYLTEKLIIAYKCGTIPIYWGCPNIEDYVNMDSILYLKNGYTEQDVKSLIGEITKLDNDAAQYKKKFESIFFKDGKVPESFDTGKLNEQVCKRISSIERFK
jgi:hypothetical protein